MSFRRLVVCAAACALVASGFAGVEPAQAAVNDGGYSRQWGMHLVGAEQAWATGTGAGTTIAIVDSGVDLGHEDLKNKITPGRNFVTPNQPPQDDNGHGTHVAGIAAAPANNGIGVVGVAPGASIMPVKVLNSEGRGAADIDEGIVWAADNGAEVINVSIGDLLEPVNGPPFVEAIDHAWRKGAIVVVSAGNEYVRASTFDDEPAIVVTATTRRDTKPDFATEVGEAQWAMAAPGGGNTFDAAEDDVFSTYWKRNQPNVYAYLAGTSMAAPHVAGAAAILRGLGLTPQQTVDRLLATAKDVGSPGRDRTFGSGRLDVAKSVAGLGPAGGSTGGTNGGGGATRGRAAGAGSSPTSAGGDSHTISRAGATRPGPSNSVGGARGDPQLQIVAGPEATAGTTTTAGTEPRPEDRVTAPREVPGPTDSDDPLPWAPVAAAVVLLGAATRGMVRARRT